MSKVVSNDVVPRYHNHNVQCSGKTTYLNKSSLMIKMLWRQCLVRCHFTKHLGKYNVQNMEKYDGSFVSMLQPTIAIDTRLYVSEDDHIMRILGNIAIPQNG